MEHLLESRIMETLWDGAELTTTERDHLALCAECQQQVAILEQMRAELEIARLSQVSATAEGRLFMLFDQATGEHLLQSPVQKLLGAFTGWVKALPLLDSRQQMAPVGIRSAHTTSSYRMLFGTDGTEIELMVEPKNGLLRVMGEVMVADRESASGLALIELAASATAIAAIETESDANGRFALERVPPGVYAMTITPRYSQVIVIEALELT